MKAFPNSREFLLPLHGDMFSPSVCCALQVMKHVIAWVFHAARPFYKVDRPERSVVRRKEKVGATTQKFTNYKYSFRNRNCPLWWMMRKIIFNVLWWIMGNTYMYLRKVTQDIQYKLIFWKIVRCNSCIKMWRKRRNSVMPL